MDYLARLNCIPRFLVLLKFLYSCQFVGHVRLDVEVPGALIYISEYTLLKISSFVFGLIFLCNWYLVPLNFLALVCACVGCF